MAGKKLNFEASMERLEEIVRMLESGSEGLDSSLKLYQEGIELVRACSERLDQAEQVVKLLQVKPDGSLAETEFEGTESFGQ